MMNILLPTDFSQSSRNAAAYALQFFQDVPCTFHFLHVYPKPAEITNVYYHAMPVEVAQKFEEQLTWLEDIRSNNLHFFEISFKLNYLIEAVRDYVIHHAIDFILMGTRGIAGQKGISIGKNTADVMMKVKCPAMVISEEAIYKAQKEILFPTDYKITYSPKMLDTLFNLTQMSQASVKILELYNTENEPTAEQLANKIFLQKSFSPDSPMVQTYYSFKNSNSCSLFLSNENVDMVVMAAKNLSLCQKLLKSSTTSDPFFLKQLPLLVLHG